MSNFDPMEEYEFSPRLPTLSKRNNENDLNEDIAVPSKEGKYQAHVNSYIKYIKQHKNRNIRSQGEFDFITKQMEWVYGRQTRLFCVDIEAWERNTELVTEIGVSIYDPGDQELALSPVIKTTHIIIEQHQNKRNGRYVPDHMNNFLEGESKLLSLQEAKSLLGNLIDYYFGESATTWCAFVGHDVQNDIDYLSKIGIHMPSKILKLDTQRLFACSHGKFGSSLQNALRTVKQPFSFLHNAGNDAYFTVLLALKLCDPNVRRLLRLDLLKDGERVGDRREYVKIPANTSMSRYENPLDIFSDLTR